MFSWFGWTRGAAAPDTSTSTLITSVAGYDARIPPSHVVDLIDRIERSRTGELGQVIGTLGAKDAVQRGPQFVIRKHTYVKGQVRFKVTLPVTELCDFFESGIGRNGHRITRGENAYFAVITMARDEMQDMILRRLARIDLVSLVSEQGDITRLLFVSDQMSSIVKWP